MYPDNEEFSRSSKDHACRRREASPLVTVPKVWRRRRVGAQVLDPIRFRQPTQVDALHCRHVFFQGRLHHAVWRPQKKSKCMREKWTRKYQCDVHWSFYFPAIINRDELDRKKCNSCLDVWGTTSLFVRYLARLCQSCRMFSMYWLSLLLFWMNVVCKEKEPEHGGRKRRFFRQRRDAPVLRQHQLVQKESVPA